jgi:hypothetical protein
MVGAHTLHGLAIGVLFPPTSLVGFSVPLLDLVSRVGGPDGLGTLAF